MSPVDAALVRRKLGHIAQGLDALAPLARLPIEEYRARLYERKAAERLLQQTIEAALDVNARIIAELEGTVPDDDYGAFIKLGDIGVLAADFAASLAPSAGLRNRLVHEYAALDDAKVLAAMDSILELYPRYVQSVEGHLAKAGF